MQSEGAARVDIVQSTNAEGEPRRRKKQRKGASERRPALINQSGLAEEGPHGRVDNMETEELMDQLYKLRARTMCDMFEDIQDSRLLFLRGRQAEIITDSAEALDSVIAKFCRGTPRAVIQLLPSPGTQAFWAKAVVHRDADFATNEIPWTTIAAADCAEAQIVNFMLHAVIPFAIQTNALIITSGEEDSCFLASALSQAMAIVGNRWSSGHVPFTVLGIVRNLAPMYYNDNDDEPRRWKQLRQESKNWRSCDDELKQKYHGHTDHMMPLTDIDRNLKNIMVYSSCDPRHFMDNFMLALLASMRATYPSIAVKTGLSSRSGRDDRSPSSIQYCIDCVTVGVPVLLLDARVRNVRDLVDLGGSQPQDDVAGSIKALCDDLQNMDPPRTDTLDVMGLSFLHTEALPREGSIKMPLCEAIEKKLNHLHHRTHAADRNAALQHLQQRTMLPQLCESFAERLFASQNNLLGRVRAQNGDQDVRRLFKKQGTRFLGQTPLSDATIRARKNQYVTQIVHLLSHPLSYSANVQGATTPDVFREILRLDRAPEENTLEGCHLIRGCWDEYDVAMYFAGWNKMLTKWILGARLMLSMLVVVVSVQPGIEVEVCEHVSFASFTILGVLTAVGAYLRPVRRWRCLRAKACSLESKIWFFRTRVSSSGVASLLEDGVAERVLASVLDEVHHNLVSDAGMQRSSLERKHSPTLYRHHQYTAHGFPKPVDNDKVVHVHGNGHTRASGSNDEAAKTEAEDNCGLDRSFGIDDFHSPVSAEAYIAWRLLPAIDFYQKRIPSYKMWSTCLFALMLFLSSMGATLAYMKLIAWLPLSVAVSSSVSAWVEFSGHDEKLTRYTTAIRQIKALLSNWRSKTSYERASTQEVVNLVRCGEAAALSEHAEWMTTVDARLSSASKRAEPVRTG